MTSTTKVKTKTKTLDASQLGFDQGWQTALQPVFHDGSLAAVLQFVEEQRKTTTVFPATQDIFNAFRYCPFADTRVVILGQDPYHGEGQAHGLAFSVLADQKLPPSLRNIYKELEQDIGCENLAGNLTSWARQGILLLNTVLTVQKATANSHRKQGWEEFTDLVIQTLGQREDPIVFILWGKPAEKKAKLIDNHHAILTSPHPSPLSAHRGFFGSKPFSQTNLALQKFGYQPIDWSIPE